MIYRSNLTMPEMTGFKLLSPAVQQMGHDCPSDPDFEPNCTFLTEDELAILYNTLHGPHMAGKDSVDIGARLGWTTKAIAMATGGYVVAVDPILIEGSEELTRFQSNIQNDKKVNIWPITAAEFFAEWIDTALACARLGIPTGQEISAFMIDGNHNNPEPLNDALGCLKLATPDCIMIFHDGRGQPICDAVEALVRVGFRARWYWTPNGMFVCWRGFEGWMPPDHVRDPAIDWSGVERQMAGQFPLSRCV